VNCNRTVLFIGLVFLAILGSLPQNVANAQSTMPLPLNGESIMANEALVDYPLTVKFLLEVDPNLAISEAILSYDVERNSCLDVSTRVPVPVEDGVIQWEWAMIRSGNPPPGVELSWEWLLTDEKGQTYITEREALTFRDDRFDWQTIEEGDVTLHWYAGEDVGPLLLEAAVAGLELLEQDMGIELQEDVEFYIYGSSNDMREAVLYIQDWAGGVAFAEYNTILMGVPPNLADSWGRSTIRHELAHLVVGQFGRSCVGGHRPTWLEEGLAMYAEGEPSEEVTADLDRGLQENSFAPLRSLNGPFPAHNAEAGTAYSQSYSVIQFLREEYGQEKLRRLILLLAEGESTDDALQEIYGVNVDGLEQSWRAWLGAPPRPIPPTPTPFSAAAAPTFEPLSRPQALPTPAEPLNLPSASAPAQPATGICGLGLVPLLLLGVFAWRKKKE
jgi:hypothetical protein